LGWHAGRPQLSARAHTVFKRVPLVTRTRQSTRDRRELLYPGCAGMESLRENRGLEHFRIDGQWNDPHPDRRKVEYPGDPTPYASVRRWATPAVHWGGSGPEHQDLQARGGFLPTLGDGALFLVYFGGGNRLRLIVLAYPRNEFRERPAAAHMEAQRQRRPQWLGRQRRHHQQRRWQ